jgi:hypothetical protein
MITQFVTLYSLDNGIMMLGIFGLVCVILVVAVVAMVFSGDGKKNS